MLEENIENDSVIKSAFKESGFLWFFSVAFIYVFAWHFYLMGWINLSVFLVPLGESIFYGSCLSALFYIFVRKIKSRNYYLLVSILATLLKLRVDMVFGYRTFYQFFLEIIDDPIYLGILFAAALFFCPKNVLYVSEKNEEDVEKPLIKDFSFIWFFSLAFFYSYARIIYFSGWKHIDKFFFPILEGVIYGMLLYIVFFLAIKKLKSGITYVLASILVTFINVYVDMSAADHISLTSRSNGITDYYRGDITQDGLINEVLNDPVYLGIPFAILFFIYSVIKRN